MIDGYRYYRARPIIYFHDLILLVGHARVTAKFHYSRLMSRGK